MLASWLLNKMLRPDLPQIFEKMMIGRIWNFEHRSTEVGDESPLPFSIHRATGSVLFGLLGKLCRLLSEGASTCCKDTRIWSSKVMSWTKKQSDSEDTRKTLGRLGTSTGPPSFTLRNWAYTPLLRNAKVFRDLFLAIDFEIWCQWYYRWIFFSNNVLKMLCVFLHLQFIQLIISIINQSLSHTPQQLNNMLRPISHFNLQCQKAGYICYLSSKLRRACGEGCRNNNGSSRLKLEQDGMTMTTTRKFIVNVKVS